MAGGRHTLFRYRLVSCSRLTRLYQPEKPLSMATADQQPTSFHPDATRPHTLVKGIPGASNPRLTNTRIHGFITCL